MLDTQTRSQKSKSGSKTSAQTSIQTSTKAASKVPTKAVARKTAAAKPRKARAKGSPAPVQVQPATPAITADERQILIEQAAYFRAEKRGFAPGSELEDWFEAEAEVLLRIGG
ncbi:MAG: DUF2934 domain-containing protein [Proteobacteria bacterium]|nr:DUF2934 domain-containing protein [Pseudomonadota bacterium]